LLGAHTEGLQRAADVHAYAVVAQSLVRLTVHTGEVDEAAAVLRLAAQEEIAGHAHQRDEVDLLVDGGDPGVLGGEWGGERHRLALIGEFAFVRVVDAGENLDQRRFAGAVLTDKRVHLARAGREGDLLQRRDAGESLGQSTDGEDFSGCGHRWPPGVRERCGGERQATAPRPGQEKSTARAQ
jgi:hypothetical protein